MHDKIRRNFQHFMATVFLRILLNTIAWVPLPSVATLSLYVNPSTCKKISNPSGRTSTNNLTLECGACWICSEHLPLIQRSFGRNTCNRSLNCQPLHNIVSFIKVKVLLDLASWYNLQPDGSNIICRLLTD